MRRYRNNNFIAAVVTTVLSFVGFVGFGLYAAVDEPNFGAAGLSLLFLLSATGSAIWCAIALFRHRKHAAPERRGFFVVSNEDNGKT